MSADGERFKVEDEQKERFRNKYSTFRTDVIESHSGSNKIQIQLRIAEEFLKISKDELKKRFDELCTAFLGTCKKYQIPFRQSDILILTDEEVDRGLQIELKSDKNGSLLGLVFIPTFDLYAPHIFWKYTFLHELGHCWIDFKYMDLETEEILTDLVAVTTLKKIIPPYERLYQNTLIIRSYIGGEQGKDYFGRDIQRDVLKYVRRQTVSDKWVEIPSYRL
jgi:hypothetical protein